MTFSYKDNKDAFLFNIIDNHQNIFVVPKKLSGKFEAVRCSLGQPAPDNRASEKKTDITGLLDGGSFGLYADDNGEFQILNNRVTKFEC